MSERIYDRTSFTPLDALPFGSENSAPRLRDGLSLNAHDLERRHCVRHEGRVGPLDGLTQLALLALARVDHQQNLVLDQNHTLRERQQRAVRAQRSGKI